jgi:TolB protein
MKCLAACALLLVPAVLPAQDSARVENGVRVGITYAPGSRPSIAVLAPARRAVALDSVRAIVERDLGFSDRFEIVQGLGPADSLAARGPLAPQYVVTVAEEGTGARVSVTETRTGQAAWSGALLLAGADATTLRRRAHQASDAVVRAITGQAGIAGTSLLFVRGGRLWRVDADGYGPRELPSAGSPALSPAFSPDGRRVAYTAFVRSGQPIVIQDLQSLVREIVPTTDEGLNITPAFSPDGRTLAFAHGTEAGTDIYLYDVGRRCCVERLTVARSGDNLSPTWSPDGARIAFISSRAQTPQLYVMASDGTGQEVLARYDFGATGQSSAPAWSPAGQLVAFHRDVAGEPQLFVVDVGSGALRQLTGAGRNEDPAWAPDGRHLAFVSSRSGTRELWVLDLETGRLRQLTRLGGARLPDWSPRPSTED